MIAIDESKWLFLQILYLHGISVDTRNRDFDIKKDPMRNEKTIGAIPNLLPAQKQENIDHT